MPPVIPDDFEIIADVGDGGKLVNLCYLNFAVFPKCGTREREEFEQALAEARKEISFVYEGIEYNYTKIDDTPDKSVECERRGEAHCVAQRNLMYKLVR